MVESVIAVVGNLLLPYLVLSLLSMLVVELIAAVLNLRGRTLREFVRHMLVDPRGTGLARDFYDHHLIASLSLGKRLPAYIPRRLFSIAVADLIGAEAERDAVSPNLVLAMATDRPAGILALLRRPRGDRDLDVIGRWYDEVMDAASGAYRLRTLIVLATVAVTVVLAFDFDAIRISNHVTQRNLLEKAVELQLQSTAKAASDATGYASVQPGLNALHALEFPLGWHSDRPTDTNAYFNWMVMKVAGLLMSVLAILAGAPFAFDLLNRFMIVRSTVKPMWEPPTESAFPAPAVAAPTDKLD